MSADRSPEQQAYRDLLLSIGIRAPLRVHGSAGRGLADADGRPVFMGVPSPSLSDDRALALAVAYAVNVAAGTPDHEAGSFPVLRPLTSGLIRAAANPLDPDHLVALVQDARRPTAE